ncbi:hypothetical protein SUGI_1141900 [Cryptomeria japonica]|nr:hypothetical protein SUGI_1141900 [Cryptomeria japonica]
MKGISVLWEQARGVCGLNRQRERDENHWQGSLYRWQLQERVPLSNLQWGFLGNSIVWRHSGKEHPHNIIYLLRAALKKGDEKVAMYLVMLFAGGKFGVIDKEALCRFVVLRMSLS